MKYKEALDFLFSKLPMYQKVGKSAFKKDLTNTIKLCKLLHNPETMFKSVHIAGTNGKGTTAHMLASIFQEAGYRTGLYTSPHLHSYTERIKINGEEIEREFIVDFVNELQPGILEIQPSFFEITVAMAFSYFAKNKVDIAIVETGLGGRLDSTNVITPELSVITNIALDHQEMLGDTIGEIAREKAGIIKNNIPVVLGNMSEEAYNVILEVARLNNSKLNSNFINYKFIENIEGGLDVYNNDDLVFENLISGIKGTYITKNIPHILESINELNSKGVDVEVEHVKRGFENVVANTGLKGRWQIIVEQPLTICDIAHNEDGINQVLDQINEIDFNRLHFVFGTVEDKIVDKILGLLPKEAKYYFCRANVPRALNTDVLVSKANENGLIGEAYVTVNAAISEAKNNAQKDDLIFIGGSTFVVAEIENL